MTSYEAVPEDEFSDQGLQVELLLSDGDGGYAAKRLPAVAMDTAAADVDGDGAPDLVTTDRFRHEVVILLGDGRGGFAKPVRRSTGGAQPAPVVATDLDRDGDVDLAVGNRTSGGLSVLLGDGDGGFSAPARYPGSGLLGDMAAADLDGDGAPELVGTRAHDVVVARNDGHGRFGAPEAAATLPFEPYETVRVGDVDGDGRPDVLAGGFEQLGFLRGDGDGGLEFSGVAYQGYGPRREPGPWDVADLDGDARADLLVAHPYAEAISTLVASGDGFAPPVRTKVGGRGGGITVADLNGDCAPDVASVVRGGVQMLLSTRQVACHEAVRLPHLVPDQPAKAVFAAPVRSEVGEPLGGVAAGDFDGDGLPDVATSTAHALVVLRGDGLGRFARLSSVRLAQGAGLAAGDVDGDGDLDLVAALGGAGGIGVAVNDERGRFSEPARYAAERGAAPRAVSLGDLDRDGDLDAVTLDAGRPGLSMLYGDGTGGFALERSWRLARIRYMAVTDLDGDGDADVVMARTTGRGAKSRAVVEVLRNEGRGWFGRVPGALMEDQDRSGPAVLAVADATRDGRPDAALAETSGYLAVLRNSGGRGTLVRATRFDAGGPHPSAVALGDLTGDGLAELAVAAGRGCGVFRGVGGGHFADPARLPCAAATGWLRIVDLNRDGAADLFAVDLESGELGAHLNTRHLSGLVDRIAP